MVPDAVSFITPGKKIQVRFYCFQINSNLKMKKGILILVETLMNRLPILKIEHAIWQQMATFYR